jgi:hypothetical protein
MCGAGATPGCILRKVWVGSYGLPVQAAQQAQMHTTGSFNSSRCAEMTACCICITVLQTSMHMVRITNYQLP